MPGSLRGALGSNSDRSTTLPKPTILGSKHLPGRLCVLSSVRGSATHSNTHSYCDSWDNMMFTGKEL